MPSTGFKSLRACLHSARRSNIAVGVRQQLPRVADLVVQRQAGECTPGRGWELTRVLSDTELYKYRPDKGTMGPGAELWPLPAEKRLERLSRGQWAC